MPSPGSGLVANVPPTPVTLREHAEMALRETIMSGRLAPGERLNEVEFANALGMSRGILREALRGLEREGLIVSQPRRGVYVRKLTKSEADEISEVRFTLEVTAARRIARGRVEASRETLERRYAELERLVDEPYPVRLRADLAFHEAICVCSGNSALARTWRSLMATYAVMLLSVGAGAGDTLLEPARHRPLLEAIESATDARIQAAWTEHFAKGVGHIVEHLPEHAEEPA